MTTVATAVASPGWHEDIAQKFAQFVSMRVADAEIRLNPAHLGPVGIEISYSDNQASVLITAAQPTTRDALEQALPHLKELLAQQGIALGESSVRDQRDARADSPSPRTPGSDAAARSAAAPISATETHRVDRLSSRLIDTFA
ncbi:MAG: flagellar hook-length control protein FliK [Betaproteobacteria bacterium]|nr:flagellar hook-length control protein FliK [Betaproteobacteria bacterium]